MAYSDNFPATRPVFMADFANGGKIDPRASFTRASTANVFDGAKHESSQNLVLQSQDLDTTWTVFTGNPAVTGGQTAPDGTSTAWAVTAQTASSAISQVQQSVSSVGASKTYTLSAYLKAGTASHTYMTLRGSGSVYGFVEIDWADPLNPRVATRTFTSASATVTAVGSGGWYRVALTTTTDASTSSGLVYIGPSDGTTQNANGYPVWNSSGETAIAWGVQLEERGSATVYNATTTQIHRAYAPTLQTAAINAPRFEHSASDSASGAKGLLIESQFTQLAQYTEDLSNGYWTKTNTTVQPNAGISPAGDLTADLVIESDDASNQQHICRTDNFTGISSGVTYTATVYAKAAGRSHCLFYTNIGGANTYRIFNLADGSLGDLSGSGTFSAQSVGNGWFRLQMTFTTVNTNSGSVYFYTASDSSTYDYTGNGYGSVLLWGANLTQSSHAYSYLKADAAATTKAADSASIAVSDITGFSEGVGTIVCETGGVASATATNQIAFGLNGPASNNQFSAGVNDGGAIPPSTVRVYSQTPAGDQAFLNAGTATVGTGYKLACRYELDNIAASMNGGTVVSDTSGQVPVGIDTLWIGELEGSYQINSNIKRIAVYNEALSDQNLISLTS